MSYASRRKERISKIISEVYKRIDLDILQEAPTPGIKIGLDNLMKTDVNKLSQLATKTDINVVDKVQEADTNKVIDVTSDFVVKDRHIYVTAGFVKAGDKVEFTSKGKKYTAIVGDNLQENDTYMLSNVKLVKGEPVEDSEEEEPIEKTQQEQAIYNLKNWAVQLQTPIGDGESAPNNAVKFTWFNPTQNQIPISILVLSNGLIKMSGHTVQDFEDYKNIINFHNQI